ncbi:MAG: molybdopterin converting factor subunit 1 [Saezia sp.]
MSQKQIYIRYFAKVRETVGKSDEACQTQAGTVAQLRAELVARGGAYEEALQAGQVLRTAVNQYMVAEDTSINDGDEVAFFPPVTGG